MKFSAAVTSLLAVHLATGCASAPLDGDSSGSPAILADDERAPSESSDDTGEDVGVSESALTRNTPTAILYFGGFSSCGYTNDNKITPLAQGSALAFGMADWVVKLVGAGSVAERPHKTLVSCYPLWTNMPGDVQQVLNTVSGTGNTGRSPLLETGIPASPRANNIYWVDDLPGKTSNVNKLTLGSFLDALATRLAAYRVTKVAIVGHSYGGYTAIAAANAILRSNKGITITKLVTLDPISMSACTPDTLIKSIRDRTPYAGCTNAPGTAAVNDGLITEQVARQLARKNIWVNYYQTRDRYLHSSTYGRTDVTEARLEFSSNPDGVVNHVGFVFPGATGNNRWAGRVEAVKSLVLGSL